MVTALDEDDIFANLELTDWVQIVLSCVIGLLTILTYLHARRTFFQPHRAEVYKRQLDLLTSLTGATYGNGTAELRKGLGISDTEELTWWLLIWSWGTHVLGGLNQGLEERLKDRDADGLAQIGAFAWLERVLDGDDPTYRRPGKAEFLAQPWVDLVLSPQQELVMKQLGKTAADPLLPTDIRDAVIRLMSEMRRTTEKIVDDAIGAAADLDSHYPDLTSLFGADIEWIRGVGIYDRGLLEARDRLVALIRGYVQPDAAASLRR
ncbi:hypothetical protein [Agromyces sp. ZXT2-3]|uniref:hypothetical protein n=1 Tax=Agromyces sp. ZXT2-3 TaxID=3461152 RepID=UPI004054A383